MWKPAPGHRPLGLLLVLALCVAVALTGCDTSVTPLEDSDPTPEQPASSDLSVALISNGMQHASSEDGLSYRCTANVLDPEAEDGYRTYDLALAFPDSVSADSSAEADSEFARLDLTLSLERTADSTAADSTKRQMASRVRCGLPLTEDALTLMADRIEADLQAQFGEEGYRFVDPDSSATGNTQSSDPDGAAVTSKTVQEDPDCDGSMSDYDSMPECEYESGVVVSEDPIDDTLPIYIPSPPQPDPYTPPSGPDDTDGSSGGGSSDGTDCSGSLQGPRSASTSAHPASGDVPTWLIPQPDADPASGSDLLDPDYPDEPTLEEPYEDCDDDTSEDEPEEEPGWGKAIRIGDKIKDAIDRGDDLLDVQTWKRIANEEWDELLGCGLDAMDATTGDPVAIIGALDCAAGQLLPVDIDFFGMLRGLDDRIGLSWYDDVIGALHNSQHFPRLAQNMGDFANTIGDLDVLKRVGQLDEETNGAYRILEGDAGRVMDNFAEKWGTEVYQRADGNWEVLGPSGNVRMTQYESGSTGLPTINVNESGSTQKVRFGDSKYSF